MPGRSVVTSGAWPASTPKSPSEPGTSTWPTSPENTSRAGDTRSKWKFAMAARPDEVSGRLGGELLALLDRFFDRADHVEGGLGKMVVLALDQALEAADRILQIDEL